LAEKKQILGIFLLALTFNMARAQNASPLGRFSVDFIKGCAPLTILVTDNLSELTPIYQYKGFNSNATNQTTYTYNTPGQFYIVQTIQIPTDRQDSLLIQVMEPVQPEFTLFTCETQGASVQITDNYYDQYEIDYGDGTIVTVNSSVPITNHFYNSAGTYTITVRGIFTNAFDNCGISSKSFTTINNISPATISSLEMQTNGEIILNYILPQSVLYDIQIAVENGNIFQKLKSISNQSSKDTIRNLNPSRNYCFRIISYDPCVNNTITSNIVCSINFDSRALDGSNEITWETVNGQATDFILEKDMSVLATPNSLEVEYLDSAIVCGQDYCYQILANFQGGGQAISVIACVTSFSTAQPDPVTDVSVNVNNLVVEIEWPQPLNFTPDQYFLEASFDNSGFSLIRTLTTNFLSGLDSAGCFRVYYQDLCGNTSARSPVGCQIMASFTENLNALHISWNDYTGWESGVSNYRLEVFNQNMDLISNYDAGLQNQFQLDLTLINEQVLIFKVIAVPVNGSLSDISSGLIVYIREPVISLPRAFTPDQDGLNDTYQVYGLFIDTIAFLVFDRWGNIVFSEKELGSGWDGTIDGKPAPAGAYVYNVEVTDFAGRTFKRSGSFLLLR
jgi:gliding motility-associated-like protein